MRHPVPAVPESFMLGERRGRCFKTGHPGEAVLGAMDRKGDPQPLFFFLRRYNG